MTSLGSPRALDTRLLTGGVICRQADTLLGRWLQDLEASDFTGWFAIYLEKPKGFQGNLAEARRFQHASQFLAEGPLKGEATVFVLHDNSSITIFKNGPSRDAATVKKHLEEILYGKALAPQVGFYDLSIQLRDFHVLCERKKPKSLSYNIPTEPKTLAPTDLDSPAFKRLLAERPSRDRLSILLVEDDRVTAQLLQHTLKQFDVYITHTATDALDVYGHIAPDMCFLDIGLPDFSGLELLKIIRAHDKKAFVVILTANSSQDNLEKSVYQGVQGFIAKPFTLGKIVSYTDMLEKQHLSRT